MSTANTGSMYTIYTSVIHDFRGTAVAVDDDDVTTTTGTGVVGARASDKGAA